MIQKLVKQYPVLAFCLLCISVAMLLGMVNIFHDYMLVLPQWSPAIAAVIIVSMLEGRSGIYSLLKKTTLKKAYLSIYIVSLMLPVLVCGLSYVILLLIADNKDVMPEFNHTWGNYAVYLIAILFGGYGEEVGWRGFMLPQLQNRYSILISSIIVGLCWGLWHLNFHLGLLTYLLYILLTIEFSIIISWFCHKSNGNIMPAIILHTAFNMSSLVLFEKILVNASNQHTLTMLYAIYAFVFCIPCILISFQNTYNHAVRK